MGRKASLHNLGCKVNAYETEAMGQMLEEAGYSIVPFGEAADVCVINTCSVTNIADKKSRQMLHRARAKNPHAVVVAAGCYVQAAAEELRQDAAVDILIGNNRKKELPQILEQYFKSREREQEKEVSAAKQKEWTIDIGKIGEYESLSISRVSEHTRAFIKIQDGCNQFCSYCLIPYTRGRVRSRKAEEVLEEVKKLVDKGCREVVLTGIHLSSYGIGAGQAKQSALIDLIGRIRKIVGVERIRLGSLEPRIVTREFAAALASMPEVCPHFHLSLQSGCKETLKRMNRHYTPEEYLERCGYLREAFSAPAITTDVIVGFPGETEEEFQRTRKFLEQVHFYEMHIFKFSPRAGTRAAEMPDQIPESVKSARSEALIQLGAVMSEEYRRSFLGKKKTVLLEEETQIEGRNVMTGYTREYVKTAIPCEALDASFNKGRILQGMGIRMLTSEVMEFLPELKKSRKSANQ